LSWQWVKMCLCVRRANKVFLHFCFHSSDHSMLLVDIKKWERYEREEKDSRQYSTTCFFIKNEWRYFLPCNIEWWQKLIFYVAPSTFFGSSTHMDMFIDMTFMLLFYGRLNMLWHFEGMNVSCYGIHRVLLLFIRSNLREELFLIRITKLQLCLQQLNAWRMLRTFNIANCCPIISNFLILPPKHLNYQIEPHIKYLSTASDAIYFSFNKQCKPIKT
jgi:hypothetical protein